MFRKTVLLVTGTVAGVVGVVGYNPPQLDAAIAPTEATPLPTAKADTQPTTATSTTKTTNTKRPAASTATNKEANTKPTETQQTTQSSGSSGTFQGNTTQTRWGPVQVEITVANGQITNVSTLQYPNGDRRSLSISNQVLPWLQQEALRTQSTNITGISGATYTSNGFKASLASALQKAGL